MDWTNSLNNHCASATNGVWHMLKAQL